MAKKKPNSLFDRKGDDPPRRGRVTLYLTKDIYEEFVKRCKKGGRRVSNVLDDLLKRELEIDKKRSSD